MAVEAQNTTGKPILTGADAVSRPGRSSARPAGNNAPAQQAQPGQQPQANQAPQANPGNQPVRGVDRPQPGQRPQGPSQRGGDANGPRGANGGNSGNASRAAEGSPQGNRAGESGRNQELSQEEQRKLEKLQKRDREVRQHEQAHKQVAGSYAGSIQYEYQKGPDGQRYAVGGSVPIDTSPVPDDPQATIDKMQTVKRAALAPAQPSSADQQIAAKAQQNLQEAQQKLKEKGLAGVRGEQNSPLGGQAGLVAQEVGGPANDNSGRNGGAAGAEQADGAAGGNTGGAAPAAPGASGGPQEQPPGGNSFSPATAASAYQRIQGLGASAGGFRASA